jgi:hypothetical protein
MYVRPSGALRRLASIRNTLVVLMATCASAVAQSPGPVQREMRVPPGMLPRPAGPPEGMTPEIEEFLKTLFSTYETASSYRDQGRLTVRQRQGRVKTTTEMPVELAFQRPNLALLDTGQHMIACDGKELMIAIRILRQYTLAPAPEKLKRNDIIPQGGGGGLEEGQPEILELLTGQNLYPEFIRNVTRVGWLSDATVDGRACRVLAYNTIFGTRLALWIDRERTVILKVQVDATSTMRLDAAGASRPQSSDQELVVVHELWPVQLDAEIDPKMFVVVPPEGLRKVRQFEQDYGAQPTETEPTGDDPVHGSHLVGKPAPALAGTDIDGKPFQLDDLKGKPALLFFFDVGGGQHDLLAIPIVQRFAQGHGGKLAVLGINAGNQGADVVRDVLKAKQADFRTVLDAERRLGLAFRLGGTPTFVLMDSGGVVRWAYLGTPPDLSERLDRQLSLLAESRPAG